MQVVYRLLQPRDCDGLLELFRQVPPTLANLSNEAIFKALIRDAIVGKYLNAYLAIGNNRPIGYVIVTWEWQRFKRTFVTRHPAIGLSILWRRIKKSFRKPRSAGPGGSEAAFLSSPTVDCRWEDNARTIAKIVFVGVDPRARGQGIGAKLYIALTSHLADRGFQRVDALISLDNTSSIKMHERAGWTVRRDLYGYFAFQKLNAPKTA